MLPISHTFLTAFIARTVRAPARQAAAAWAFLSSRLSLQPTAAPSVPKARRIKGRAFCLLSLLRRKLDRVGERHFFADEVERHDFLSPRQGPRKSCYSWSCYDPLSNSLPDSGTSALTA